MKTIVIGAGPVGALAAIYAAQRGHEVEVYELRNGELWPFILFQAFQYKTLFSVFQHFLPVWSF
jgi:2-polyprenyl-6-methoxyphenol hydroxylase-like FAD-dependent oxidoreductase